MRLTDQEYINNIPGDNTLDDHVTDYGFAYNPSVKDTIKAQIYNLNRIEQQIINLDTVKEEIEKIGKADINLIEKVGYSIEQIDKVTRYLSQIYFVYSNLDNIHDVALIKDNIKELSENLDLVRTTKTEVCYMRNDVNKLYQYSSAAYAKINKLYNDKLKPQIDKLELLNNSLTNQLTESVQTIQDGHEMAVKWMTYTLNIKVCRWMNYEASTFVEFDDVRKIITLNIPEPRCIGVTPEITQDQIKSVTDAYLATLGNLGSGLDEPITVNDLPIKQVTQLNLKCMGSLYNGDYDLDISYIDIEGNVKTIPHSELINGYALIDARYDGDDITLFHYSEGIYIDTNEIKYEPIEDLSKKLYYKQAGEYGEEEGLYDTYIFIGAKNYPETTIEYYLNAQG